MKRGIILIIAITIMISAYIILKNNEEENKKPTAIFIATPENARINETATTNEYPEIHFDASESKDPDGKIINYFWDFGDGNFTNLSRASHNKTYQKSGKFDVKLIVTDNDGNNDTNIQIITIDYHKEENGLVSSGENEKIPFPVNNEAVSCNIIVNITNTGNPITGSDVEVTVYDKEKNEVTKEEKNGIRESDKIEITLTQSQFETHGYGKYTLEIKCTRGNITYDSTIDVYYHQWFLGADMKNKKVVITGGAGFIGSNLAEELMKNNEVIVIDNFSTGKKENLIGLDGIKIINGSITDIKLLQKEFENVDYVFHQGALPSVPRSVENPISSNKANIDGTLNVLVAARDNNVKKVVYASSSSAYGDTPELPKKETMIPNPLSPYAITKLTGEYYCKIFTDVYGLATTSLRYFNVYGPKQDPTSQYSAVIPKFITRVMNNQNPIIYGDGEQTRDFTFVKDVVQANILSAESKKCNREVLNIACGKRITINKLAKEIINAFGKNLDLKHTKPRVGDVKHSLADISKAKELIGFEPKYSLKKGLEITIDYFKK